MSSLSFNWEYWTRQVPISGRALALYDNWRFFNDYRKNTGFTARYPGRSYPTGATEGIIASGASYGKMLNKLYNKW